MALSRTWWAAAALTTAVAAGTTGFVLSDSKDSEPTASSTYMISTVADAVSAGSEPTVPTPSTTVVSSATPTGFGTGSADLASALPPGIPFIDTNTCDAWFEDWDDRFPTSWRTSTTTGTIAATTCTMTTCTMTTGTTGTTDPVRIGQTEAPHRNPVRGFGRPTTRYARVRAMPRSTAAMICGRSSAAGTIASTDPTC